MSVLLAATDEPYWLEMFWGVCSMLIGVYSVTGAVCNWDWFMNHRSAAIPVALLTRTGARLFYIAVGVAIFVIGVNWVIPDA